MQSVLVHIDWKKKDVSNKIKKQIKMNSYTYVHVNCVVAAPASGSTNVVISQQSQMSKNKNT